MKTVVFVETNFSGLDAILYCKQKGYRSILITDSIDRFRKWFPASCLYKLDLADQIIPVKNSSDVHEVLQVLEEKVGKVDALLTFAEIRTKVAAQLCRALRLPGASVESIEIAQDKHRFRHVLAEKGAETVQCRRIESAEALASIKDEISFPCFLKPVQGHSSIGAVVCNDASDIERVVGELNGITEDWISPAFVVEDYLIGELVSVEILTTGSGSHQIVGVSDRDVIGTVEIGASFPQKSIQREAIEKKACAALDAIGYGFGASHVEIIVTDAGPRLVEVNTRVGGSGHSIMLDLSTSRSIVGDCVELCLGNLALNGRLYHYEQGAAWRCFVSEASGTITKMPSAEEIKARAGVKEVWLHHELGDEVGPLNSNFAWIVQVMCVGDDQPSAKANAIDAVDFIAQNTRIES